MDFVYQYYSLLPDFGNMLISLIPTISYFTSTKIYSYFHQGKKTPTLENIRSSSKNMIAVWPGNIFISYPLFNYFSYIEGVSFFNILLGIFIIDTMEYFYHYLLHLLPFLYKFHSVSS